MNKAQKKLLISLGIFLVGLAMSFVVFLTERGKPYSILILIIAIVFAILKYIEKVDSISDDNPDKEFIDGKISEQNEFLTKMIDEKLRGLVTPTPKEAETELDAEFSDIKKKAMEHYEKGYDAYYKSDFDNAIKHFNFAIAEAKIAAFYLAVGNAYFHKYEYPKALESYQVCKEIAEKSGKDKWIGFSKMNEGLIYFREGKYSEALNNYNAALVLMQKNNCEPGLAAIYLNTGTLLFDTGKLDEAFQLYNQSLNIYRKINDGYGESQSLKGIGIFFAEKKRFDEALQSFKNSLYISTQLEYSEGEAAGLSNIGIVLAEMGKFNEALQYFENALKINQRIHNHLGEANVIGSIGNIYFDQEKFDDALDSYNKALKIFKKVGAAYQIQISIKNIDRAKQKIKQST